MQRVQERSTRPLTPPPRPRRTRRTAPAPHRRRTQIHPVNAGHQRFVGGRSAIDGCSYLGRPPDKIRWCSFPQPAMVLGRITEQWRASRRYRRTSHGSAYFGASPERLGIGVCHCFHINSAAPRGTRMMSNTDAPVRLATRCPASFSHDVDNLSLSQVVPKMCPASPSTHSAQLRWLRAPNYARAGDVERKQHQSETSAVIQRLWRISTID